MTKWLQQTDVTVLMPIYNGLLTMGRALESLLSTYQSIPLRLIVVDDGSRDGSQELLASASWQMYQVQRGFQHLQVLEPLHPPGESPERCWDHDLMLAHVRDARRALLLEVRTPWAWFVDQDVMVPAGGGRALLDAAEGDEKLGALGILCEPVADHVRFDCALLRTKPAQALVQAEWGLKGCECRWMHQALRRDGWIVGYLEGWTGRHLRREMAGMGYVTAPRVTDQHTMVITRGAKAARAVLKALRDLEYAPSAEARGATPGSQLRAAAADLQDQVQGAAPPGEGRKAADGRGSANHGVCVEGIRADDRGENG